MSTYEKHISPRAQCDKNLETFAGAIIDDKDLARNDERKIGGKGRWEKGENGEGRGKPEGVCVYIPEEKDVTSVLVSIPEDKVPEFGKDGGKNKFLETSVPELRLQRSNVETGYLTKNPKILVAPEGAKEETATGQVKMSSMEEEAVRERMRMTLLKQCSAYLAADGSSRYIRDTFRRVFTEKEFLERLFKLFDQDRDGILVQEEWVEFLKLRLTGEKQIDFAEQVESVAYVLCGEEAITFEKFCQIFKAKGIVDKVFRLIDEDGDGVVTQTQIMEFVANLSNARFPQETRKDQESWGYGVEAVASGMFCAGGRTIWRVYGMKYIQISRKVPLWCVNQPGSALRTRTGLGKESLEWLEKIFRETVGNEKEIRREDFNKILLSKNPFFTDRVFEIFDKDNSGTISLEEFIDAMHQFAGKSPDDKIRFLFKVYDLDGDGLIQHKELQHVMRACMEENGMKFSEDQIEDLTMAMFEDADPHNRGAITYEALKNQLEKHGGLLENLTISIDRWLVPAKPKAQPTSLLGKLKKLTPYQLTRPYLKNNYVFIIFVTAFIFLNAILFVSRSIEYRNSNGFVIVARACGQCLNFNCMFILVLMLRHCITFLRAHGFSTFLPLDQHIYLHKFTGLLIFIYSVVHTVMHLMNFGIIVRWDPVINARNFTLTEWVLTSKPGLYGLVGGAANPTGVALIIILSVMFICSQKFVRRGGCFEVFYWTHLLYVPFWILVIFHGPNFWKWFVGPGIIYVIERVVRMVWLRSDRGKTYISSGLLLPSRVTHLVIKRPPQFDYCPGDYVFVNIPAIAKYEWHPFTISSAPEQEDYMWLHIRGVGEWTNRLYEYFDREQEKLHNVQDQIVAAQTGIQSGKKAYLLNGDALLAEKQPVKKLQSSLERKFSKREKEKTSPARVVSFKRDPLAVSHGITNESYSFDSSDDVSLQTTSEGDISPRARGRKLTPDKKLHMLLMAKKQPLEKSQSMPDMQTRLKKRERLLALREYARSESERSFDEVQMKRARLQSLGLAYLSPQNKSLAQSFRYMRNKPTIIAFKTPSLENCEAQISAMALAQNYSKSEKSPEEGRFRSVEGNSEDSGNKFPLTPINYPVAGKPLEFLGGEGSGAKIVEKCPSRYKRLTHSEETEIYIDGPYGAPSSHIFRAQHAVLIATGIGVTPFASILQSIMHRYWKARHTCPQCKFSWASEIPPTVMNLRKVDFFWINRDQRSFEWFVNLLSQLEIEQAELGAAMERFLEMHMYITSALQRSDMKAVGLQLALDLLHEKEKRDLITGLKTRTNAGRPNWDKVFKQLLDQKKGKITVFYCGPPQLGRQLRLKCDHFGFNFRKEVF